MTAHLSIPFNPIAPLTLEKHAFDCLAIETLLLVAHEFLLKEFSGLPKESGT